MTERDMYVAYVSYISTDGRSAGIARIYVKATDERDARLALAILGVRSEYIIQFRGDDLDEPTVQTLSVGRAVSDVVSLSAREVGAGPERASEAPDSRPDSPSPDAGSSDGVYRSRTRRVFERVRHLHRHRRAE